MDNRSGKDSFDASKVALLARLDLSPEDLKKFQGEMEAIVGYVETLSELDVEGIEPTAHAIANRNVLRDDAVAEDRLDRRTLLSNAPDTVDSELVKMPQVLPGEGM